jgi:hypothetical protein
MVWALDKMDSPADRSPGEQVPTEAAGIGTNVRPGKVRSYAVPLNNLIARDKLVRFGEGDIDPGAPVVRASRSGSKTEFLM